MRISDWSSDVCSSDLPDERRLLALAHLTVAEVGAALAGRGAVGCSPAGCGRVGRLACGHRADHSAQRAAALLCAAFLARGPRRRIVAASSPAQDCRPPCRSYPKRSEEHTSELQSLMRISYAVFCLKKKKTK